jgi:putative transcriptional regulator
LFSDPTKAGLLAFGSVGFLPEEPEGDHDGIVRARVFAGYSGWAAGQLEEEIGEDAWLLTPATEADVFTGEPDRLWQRVIGRLGPAYAVMRTMPTDPAMN